MRHRHRRFGPGPYLTGLRRTGRWGVDFPFDVPAVAAIEALDLSAPVTLLACDNGTGKSTIAEAVAEAMGFAAEGGELAIVVRAAEAGAQFVIATHSPILLAIPGARISRPRAARPGCTRPSLPPGSAVRSSPWASTRAARPSCGSVRSGTTTGSISCRAWARGGVAPVLSRGDRPRVMRPVVDLPASGALRVDDLPVRYFPFERAVAAYRRLDANPNAAVEVALTDDGFHPAAGGAQ